MQRSIYLARLIGPVLAVVGIGMQLNVVNYRIMVGEFLHSLALIYFAGLFAFIAGLAIVLAHNVWTADWRVIITILGWFGIVGGTVRLLAPRLVMRIGENMIALDMLPVVGGVVVLGLGAALCYFGYLAKLSPDSNASRL